MIHVEHLTKRFGLVCAVEDLSFDVDAGTVVGFLGPNGAGKTTTMRILAGFLSADSGVASIAGFDVQRDSLAARRQLGYMPENAPLYGDMRVAEYLTFRAALRDIPRRERAIAVSRVCEQCWLSKPDMTRRRIDQLSRGYRQRVALADVLLHDPAVLILDEPTVGLDPTQIRETRHLIRSLAGEHTVLLSTHILPEVEQTCDSLLMIAGGKLVARGTLDELTNASKTEGSLEDFFVQATYQQNMEKENAG